MNVMSYKDDCRLHSLNMLDLVLSKTVLILSLKVEPLVSADKIHPPLLVFLKHFQYIHPINKTPNRNFGKGVYLGLYQEISCAPW